MSGPTRLPIHPRACKGDKACRVRAREPGARPKRCFAGCRASFCFLVGAGRRRKAGRRRRKTKNESETKSAVEVGPCGDRTPGPNWASPPRSRPSLPLPPLPRLPPGRPSRPAGRGGRLLGGGRAREGGRARPGPISALEAPSASISDTIFGRKINQSTADQESGGRRRTREGSRARPRGRDVGSAAGAAGWRLRPACRGPQVRLPPPFARRQAEKKVTQQESEGASKTRKKFRFWVASTIAWGVALWLLRPRALRGEGQAELTGLGWVRGRGRPAKNPRRHPKMSGPQFSLGGGGRREEASRWLIHVAVAG